MISEGKCFGMIPDDAVQGDRNDRRNAETHEKGIDAGAGLTLQAPADCGAPHALDNPGPTSEAVTSVLSTIFCSGRSPHAEVVVLDRRPNVYASTFHSEVITCRLPDGSKRRVLCKHSSGFDHNCYGHRGGVPYEAEVYRSVLAGSSLTIPAFYGDQIDADAGECWLILEFLENSLRVKHSPEPDAMMLAARWIGRFHALSEARLPCAPLSFLKRYDAHYFMGWSHRTWLYARSLRDRYPWLPCARDRYAEAVAWLLARRPTVIHGEYYSVNVLLAGGSVYPVDWESAAIAAGEIDLASLTERWPEKAAREMELAYQQARWPDGVPLEFEKTLAAARLYLVFRWLGDRQEWTTGEECAWRFEQLRLASERWELT